MHLILEGPDNSGKTTLAKKLVAMCRSEANVEYWHAGGPPTTVQAELDCLRDQFEMVANGHPRQFIIDRVTCISQQVYNPDTIMHPNRQQALLQLSMHRNCFIIYARPSTDKLLRSDDMTWRAEEPEEHRQKILCNLHTFVQGYDRVMSAVRCIQYDYEDPNSQLLIDMALMALHGSQDARNWFEKIITQKR